MTSKSYFLCVVFVLFSATNVCAEKIAAQSSIKEVTVYPRVARVTRKAELSLTPGEHTIVLENIVPHIDEKSLTVSGAGVAKVKIFGAYIKTEYLKEASDKRIQELESAIEKLSDELVGIEIKKGTLSEQKAFLESVKLFSGNQIPQDLVTDMPETAELKTLLSFLSDEFSGVASSGEALRIKERNLKREREALQRELSQVRRHDQKTQRSIAVDVSCVKAGKFTVAVSYMVSGTQWTPVYDARADLSANTIELTAYGVITQRTGEDWENVTLTLSTAKPTVSGTMPYIDPWILKIRQPAKPMVRKRAKGMALMQAVDSVGAPADYEPYSLAEALDEERHEADVAFADIKSKGVSVVYELARPVTVLSDGQDNKFPITTQQLAAQYRYSTYPRRSQVAFLRSSVTNAKDIQLLPGSVNLFRDEDYIGTSRIGIVGPGEEFDLYLGVDENVKVERKQISKNIDDTLIGGIRSSNIKTTFEYQITVENYTKKKATVLVYEAMPVSENDRIKVKVFDVSLKPTEKDWKNRKGIWLWDIPLNPGQKKIFKYSFVVEHQRDLDISGL